MMISVCSTTTEWKRLKWTKTVLLLWKYETLFKHHLSIFLELIDKQYPLENRIKFYATSKHWFCLETWLSLLYLKSSCGSFYIGRMVMLICVLSVATVHVLFSLTKSANELFLNAYSIIGINVHTDELLWYTM